MSVLVYLLVAMLIYAAWLPTIKLGLKRLSCSRSFSRNTVFEGEEGEMIEVIRNDSPFMIPWLRLESKGSPYVRLGSQENLDVSGEMFYTSLFSPMPYQQIKRTHKVKFLRRGVYHLGTASLTAGDILDALRHYRVEDLDASVMVYPKILDDDQIPPIMSQRLGELANRRMLLQDPFLVRGIRPYVPGDPVRDIHWPATARMQQTQIRLRDYTTSTRLLVVLNGQIEDMQWGNRAPDQMEDTFEEWISLAATLCIRGLEQGIPTGFATNMSLDGSSDTILMAPQDGTAQQEELLSIFARLDAMYCRLHFPSFVKDLGSCTGLDIMILSCYDSPSMQNAIEQLRKQGNQVTLHLLEGGRI